MAVPPHSTILSSAAEVDWSGAVRESLTDPSPALVAGPTTPLSDSHPSLSTMPARCGFRASFTANLKG